MLFGWPQNIEAILELSFARLTSRRERAEEELKLRVVDCEEKLVELGKDIDVFRRKEVSLQGRHLRGDGGFTDPQGFLIPIFSL